MAKSAEQKAAEKAAKEAAKSAKNADVVNVVRNGEVIRSYSEAEHGEKFLSLAREFASKEAGREVVGA